MKNRIEQLIEGLLVEARPEIEEHGNCEPRVLILHSGGVESLVICGARSDSFEWAKIEYKVNKMLEELNGDVVIMLKNTVIGEETSSPVRSLESPSPISSGALQLTVWSIYGFGTTGEQRYMRSADGTVFFAKFHLDKGRI